MKEPQMQVCVLLQESNQICVVVYFNSFELKKCIFHLIPLIFENWLVI